MDESEKENETNQIRTIIQSFTNSIPYTWETEGDSLLSDSKINYNKEEKQILSALIILESPSLQRRRKLWLIASGAKREMINNPGYYNSLLNTFPSTIETPSVKTIDLDIHRTFGQEKYFLLKNSSTKLRNVLIAISRRLTSIGYCQGFNFMVGRILKICDDEEETFWIFIQIVEKYLQLNYYTDLSGLMIDCIITSRILTNIFPDVIEQLAKTNFDISLTNYLFKSFLCLFAENLNEYMLQIIWDVLFIKGDIILFKALICLIKAHNSKMLAIKSLNQINALFAEEMLQFKDKEMMIYYLLLKRFDFSNASIENNRLLFFPTLKAQLIKISSSLSSMDKDDDNNKERSCDVTSPICVNRNNNNNHHPDVFVLRQLESQIAIKKSYFFKECQSYPFEKESNIAINTFPSLLIERAIHSCNDNKGTKESSKLIRLNSFEGQEYIHSLIKELNA